MGKKLTLEIVKERLKDINPMVEIIDDVYVSANTKLKCRCLKDGHEWCSYWKHLNNGVGCPKCANNIKLTLEQVKDNIRDINSNIKILSDEYASAHKKLKCICLLDGHEWEAEYSNLQQGNGCPKCAKRIKLDIDIVRERLKSINENIIIKEDSRYETNTSRLNLECLIDGYNWVSDWASLQQGQGCPKCAGNIMLDIDTVKSRVRDMGLSLRILSKEYRGAYAELSVACTICGNEYETCWSNLRKGRECFFCNGGFYSRVRAERNREEWERINSKLYLIECFSEDELFYKIGITKKNIDDRFSKGVMPYEYRVIEFYHGNLYDVVIKENKIRSDFARNITPYKPSINFIGYTECFSVDSLDYVKQILFKWKVGED